MKRSAYESIDYLVSGSELDNLFANEQLFSRPAYRLDFHDTLSFEIDSMTAKPSEEHDPKTTYRLIAQMEALAANMDAAREWVHERNKALQSCNAVNRPPKPAAQNVVNIAHYRLRKRRKLPPIGKRINRACTIIPFEPK